MTFRSVAFLGLSLSLSLPAHAGTTLSYGSQSFRGLEFSGNIDCTTTLGLQSNFTTPGANSFSGAPEFDKFDWGDFSLDGLNSPSGPWLSFFSPTSGGRLLLYQVTVNYDATACGTSTGISLDYGWWDYSGPGAGPNSIYLVAGPDSTAWTDYTSGGLAIPATTAPTALSVAPYALDAVAGFQSVPFVVGVWFPPTTQAGHHQIRSYVVGTVNY